MPVTVATFLEPSEAHIVCGRLQAEGLDATVAFDGHVGANWPMALALGGVAVQVPVEQIAGAHEILRGYASGEYAGDVDAVTGAAPDACPACGAHERVARVPLAQKALAVVVFLFGGATFPTRQSDVACARCGAAWPVEA